MLPTCGCDICAYLHMDGNNDEQSTTAMSWPKLTIRGWVITKVTTIIWLGTLCHNRQWGSSAHRWWSCRNYQWGSAGWWAEQNIYLDSIDLDLLDEAFGCPDTSHAWFSWSEGRALAQTEFFSCNSIWNQTFLCRQQVIRGGRTPTWTSTMTKTDWAKAKKGPSHEMM